MFCDAKPETITSLNGLLAVLIAAVAAYVAYQQWRLAQAKLIADNFDKRFSVYMATLDLIKEAVRLRGWPDQADFEFQRQIETSKFLFPPNVTDRLEQIRRMALDMTFADDDIKDEPIEDQERRELQKERRETRKFLAEEIPRLAKMFAPHMKVQ